MQFVSSAKARAFACRETVVSFLTAKAFALAIVPLMNTPVRADGSWAEPAKTVLDSLEQGLVSVAAPIVGVGIIAYALWAMASGRIDLQRLLQLGGAAVLVFFGPQLLRTLMGQ